MFTLVLWCSPFSYCASTHLFVISFLISRSYYYIIIYYWKYNFPKNTIMSVCWLAGWSFGYSFQKCRDDTLSTLILRTYVNAKYDSWCVFCWILKIASAKFLKYLHGTYSTAVCACVWWRQGKKASFKNGAYIWLYTPLMANNHIWADEKSCLFF